MAKRIITKIGDVFCAEIEGKYKCYFQYVCKDMNQLNSSVIRVFKTRYPLKHEPILDDIVRDDVAFYAHTVLRAGIDFNVWYKVGKKIPILNSNHESILWGTVSEILNLPNLDFKVVNPLTNWRIWHINGLCVDIGALPMEFWDTIEEGSVNPFIEIISRIKLGYYKYSSPIYDIIKRIPHPDVNSYIRKEVGNSILYQHFLGGDVIREIVLKEDGHTELLESNPLDRPKFWETNWASDDFITEAEFDEAWRKCH